MQTFYVKRSDGAFVSFNGMTQEQITAMFNEQNITFDFIDEAAYNAGSKPRE